MFPTIYESKEGKWLETHHTNQKRCSVCDRICFIAIYPWFHGQAAFCPACGAKMDDVEEWELLWRNSVLSNTVFEKVNDDTYAIPLIPQYLTIYLNSQGYNLIKQGLIPPQLYFYSPFSGIEDFEEINLNKKANLGFILEILMDIECDESIDRRVTLHNLITERIEEITLVEEENWTANEKALYNYYSLSYYGEFRYLKEKGYIDSIEVDDLTKSITVQDFIVLVNKVLAK